MARDNRRNIKIPKKRDTKKITKDYSWNRYEPNKKILNSTEEALEEWAPKIWTNEFPEIISARINKSTISIESLIDKFANLSIHCSIRVDESFFHCYFVGNRKGSKERMRGGLKSYEIKKGQRITGRPGF